MNEPGGIAVRQATISDLDLLAPFLMPTGSSIESRVI
jgi:hypothetical protein